MLTNTFSFPEEIILLITELVPGGSLETMLNCKRESGEDGKYKNINCELNERELVNIALQVATGMQHLERKKVNTGYNGMTVHRDASS